MNRIQKQTIVMVCAAILFAVVPSFLYAQIVGGTGEVSIRTIIQESPTSYTIETIVTPPSGHTIGDPMPAKFVEVQEEEPQAGAVNQFSLTVDYNELNETYYGTAFVDNIPQGTPFEYRIVDATGSVYVPWSPLEPSSEQVVITFLPSKSGVDATQFTIAGRATFADLEEPEEDIRQHGVRIRWREEGGNDTGVSSEIPFTLNPASGQYEFIYTQDGLQPDTTYIYEIVDSSTQKVLSPPETATTIPQTGGGTNGGGSGTPGSGTTSGGGISITSIEDIVDTFSAPEQTVECTEGEGEYCLVEPLPGLTKIGTETSFGEYVNIIIKILIGLIGVISVIMLIIGGIQYMSTEAIYGKSDAKGRMTGAIGGLILAVGSYLILNTLNPNLLVLDPTVEGQIFEGQEIEGEAYGLISQSDFTNITGQQILSQGEYLDMANSAASEAGVRQCVAQTILAKESNAQPNAVGIDENVTRITTSSRKYFLESGHYYYYDDQQSPDATFPSTEDYNADIYNRANENHEPKEEWPIDPSSEGLGLDWRFSKGIGLTQFTFFPDGYFDNNYSPDIEDKDNYPTETFNGQSYTPRELLDPQTNLEAGLNRWKYFYDGCAGTIKNNNSLYSSTLNLSTTAKEEAQRIEAAFYGYAQGFTPSKNEVCNGRELFGGVENEVKDRIEMYLECEAQ